LRIRSRLYPRARAELAGRLSDPLAGLPQGRCQSPRCVALPGGASGPCRMDADRRTEGAIGTSDPQVHLGAFVEGRVGLEEMPNQQAQVVVALSGGMDSAVCAALAVRDFGAGATAALHISYGQRTEAREQSAFEAICDRLDIHRRLVVRTEFFRAIGGSALTDDRIAVPDAGPEIGA